MKKNVMLKIAAVLLVAVLLSTCAISATFAKYTTDLEEKSSTVTVAKWGITGELTAAGGSNQYSSADGSVKIDSGNAMAPGTSDTITFTSKVTGTAEVSLKVDYTATVTFSDGFATNMPLTFSVNNGEVKSFTTSAAAKEYLEATINDLDQEVAAGVAAGENALTITWAWPFDAAGNDDNALGNSAAESFTITVDAVIAQTGPAVASN